MLSAGAILHPIRLPHIISGSCLRFGPDHAQRNTPHFKNFTSRLAAMNHLIQQAIDAHLHP
jgi:hypothetical protein